MLPEVLIELGEHAAAAEWLRRARAKFDAIGNHAFEFSASLVEAYLAMAANDEAGCAAALRTALSIGRTHGCVNTLNWYARMMSRLCAFALEHDIEVEYVRMLIQRRQLIPERPIERWPWPVKLYTLGRFEMRIDGEPVHFEGKAQRKPMELAKVLIALGGRDIPVGKVIDILWPEPSEGDGQKAFDITVHRLRKLLGSDDAVHVADHRATLNSNRVWVDAWSLERTLGPLVAATGTAQPDIASLEAAAPQVMSLYRGHFLADEAVESWQIPVRNRLAGRFERFALRLGEHWESQKQWRRALDLYERAVELDPIAESFYRRQMVCLQAQGQRAEAIEVFRRCRQLLSVTLGIAPTGETEAVYRQLLAP
jgi:DNA-binding SARP family transcriptional activator